MTNEELQDTRSHVWAMFATGEKLAMGALVEITKPNANLWEMVAGNADKLLAEWDKRFGGKNDETK